MAPHACCLPLVAASAVLLLAALLPGGARAVEQKTMIFNTQKLEPDGGGLEESWGDLTKGDTTMRNWKAGKLACGMSSCPVEKFSLKLDFNECPWRYWTAFKLHSKKTFTAKDNNYLFFQWAGNNRSFAGTCLYPEMIIELESSVNGQKILTNVPAYAMGNTDDINNLAMPLKPFLNVVPGNTFNSIAFKVRYWEGGVFPGTDKDVVWYMSDIFIGTIDGDKKPAAPLDTKNWDMFSPITNKEVIYDGNTAKPPLYVNTGWSDWSWGALMPRKWNVQWTTNSASKWVMNKVAKSCDDKQEQAMTLLTSIPFTATESTFLHFKYFGDWRDVKLRLESSSDPGMVVNIALADHLPSEWVDAPDYSAFEYVVVPLKLAAAAFSKPYDTISFVHDGPLKENSPLCFGYGSTSVRCQTVWLADVFLVNLTEP